LVIFRYAGHGSDLQFLKDDDIQNLKAHAVTFLFGSGDLGGEEGYKIWHFFLIASW